MSRCRASRSGGGYTLVFQGADPAANVNINSLGGSGNIEIAANVGGALNQAVVLKVAGKNPAGATSRAADPTDMVDADRPRRASGGSRTPLPPPTSTTRRRLQIVYPGTGTISMTGNPQAAATIYAPNADVRAPGHCGLVRFRAGQEDRQRRQREHSLRPPPAVSVLRGRTADGGTFSWKRSS